MGVLWYETAIGSRSFLCVFVCVVSANYKNQKQTAWISPPNSTHLILMRWLSAKPLLAWLSHRATAAPLCVCFLVPYLPHGQNMALAFTQTKCLQSIAMSASVELMISHKPKQLFLSLADLKAATPSFLLSSVAHISLIANKMIRNLCANDRVCFAKLFIFACPQYMVHFLVSLQARVQLNTVGTFAVLDSR